MLPLLLAQAGIQVLNAYQGHKEAKAQYKHSLRQQEIDNRAVEQQANIQRSVSLFNYQTALDGLKQDSFDTELARMQTISAARAAAGAAGVNGASYDQTLRDISGNAARQQSGITRQAAYLGADLRNELTNIEARRVFGKSYEQFSKPSALSAGFSALGGMFQSGVFDALGKGARPKATSNYISSVQASRL